MSGQRIALVHDWLTGMRGGEKVLEVLCRMYPSADLLTLVHVPNSVSPEIEQHHPRTSFLQRLRRWCACAIRPFEFFAVKRRCDSGELSRRASVRGV